MKQRYLPTLLFFFFLVAFAPLSAQEEMMGIARAQEYLHPETALILVAVSSGSFNPVDIPADPVKRLQEIGHYVPLQVQQHLNGEIDSDPWTSLGAFSFLVTQLYDIPGGIFYALFPGPHYAIKELQQLGLIPQNKHPRQPISGLLATEIIEKLNMMLENGDIR